MEATRWEDAAVDPEPVEDPDETMEPIEVVAEPRTPETDPADWVDQQLDAPLEDDDYDR